MHTDSIFDELGLVGKLEQAQEPHMERHQEATNYEDAKYANV
jgi:hypothetical protein